MPNKYKFESVESGNPSVACKQYIQMRVLSNICKYISIDFQTHLCLIQNKCFCEKRMRLLSILKGLNKGKPADSKPLEQCMYYMKINDLNRFTETLAGIQNWTELRGTIPIQIYKNEPGMGTLLNIKCTLLHMAVILQNVNALKLLIHESKIRPDELQTYLDEKVTVQVSHLEPDAKWIQGASVAHLAARFCP